MIAARALLRRYPALRQTWPVQRARTWREEQNHRRNPRRMAAWFRDMPDLHTRLCVSNLDMPEAPHLTQPRWLSISLLDAEGSPLALRRLRLVKDASLILELADLLPRERRGRVPSGQVRVDFEGPYLGSSRAYLHWYNEHSLTSSHEKFGLTIPAVGGYWTVPSVQHTPSYRTHLAVVNLADGPYESTVVLKDAAGRPSEAALHLPRDGSRFLALEDLFPDPASLLGEDPGILSFGNNQQPAMYYYFIRDDTRGTWRAQHL